MFPHHIVSFSRTHDQHPKARSQRKIRRTDHVPHVLDKEDVKIGEVERRESVTDPVRIEVTLLARVDVFHRDSVLPETGRVVLAGDVPDNRSDRFLRRGSVEQLLYELSFAAPGATDEFHREDVVFVDEPIVDLTGPFPYGRQDVGFRVSRPRTEILVADSVGFGRAEDPVE